MEVDIRASWSHHIESHRMKSTYESDTHRDQSFEKHESQDPLVSRVQGVHSHDKKC